MKFQETKLPGVFEINVEPFTDHRGFFARSWCKNEFREHDLDPNVAQCSASFNHKKGTLRGMHYQVPPFAETKLVRCTMGSIFDVAIDLRPGSMTFKNWVGVVLSAENRKALYIPAGCAHGFLALEDKSEVFYMISEFYDANSARGVRWNDPAFAIEWPLQPDVIADRDRNYPDFKG